MITIRHEDLSFILNEIAKSLDISDTCFKEAEAKYKAVGEWLGEGNSPLARFSARIYPQGSFLLGIVVKPLGDADDYDLDLVFELFIGKEQLTQKQLKELVGARLREHQTYKHMLDEEGRRCWTLLYADGAQFHMDILPAVPDLSTLVVLKERGVPQRLAETSIAITDNTRPDYERITSEWPGCNPKGYAAWFKERMTVQFEKMRRNLAETYKAQIDDVPEYEVRTPLQRSIQLLKRHRDIMFQDDPDNKPASIIITTLAARAYTDEADLTVALISMAENMPTFIEVRNGVPWVANPVDPAENFAERWQDKDHPEREKKFRQWLNQVKTDVYRILTCDDVEAQRQLLSSLFGERVSNMSINRYKEAAAKRTAGSVSPHPTKPTPVAIIPNKPWAE